MKSLLELQPPQTVNVSRLLIVSDPSVYAFDLFNAGLSVQTLMMTAAFPLFAFCSTSRALGLCVLAYVHETQTRRRLTLFHAILPEKEKCKNHDD